MMNRYIKPKKIFVLLITALGFCDCACGKFVDDFNGRSITKDAVSLND